MLIRDTTLWTLARQGVSPTGQRVILYRTRTSARHELVVGREVVQSFGPRDGERAHAAFAAAAGEALAAGRRAA